MSKQYYLKAIPKTTNWRILTPLKMPVLPVNIERHVSAGAALYYVKHEAVFFDDDEQAGLVAASNQMAEWGAGPGQRVLVSLTLNEKSPQFDESSFWMSLGGVAFNVDSDHLGKFFAAQEEHYRPVPLQLAIARELPTVRREAEEYGILEDFGNEVGFFLIDVMQYIVAKSKTAREFFGIPAWGELTDWNLLTFKEQENDKK